MLVSHNNKTAAMLVHQTSTSTSTLFHKTIGYNRHFNQDIDILTKEFDFEFANWYYKKILYLTVITNRCISVNLTTKTGFYKAQIVFVFMDLAERRFAKHSCE